MEVEQGKHFPIKAVLTHFFGDGVDRFAVVHGEDTSERNVAEHRDLLHDLCRHLARGAASNDVGLDARLHEADAELGGLGLLFPYMRGVR